MPRNTYIFSHTPQNIQDKMAAKNYERGDAIQELEREELETLVALARAEGPNVAGWIAVTDALEYLVSRR